MPVNPEKIALARALSGTQPPSPPQTGFLSRIGNSFTNMAQQGLQDFANAGVPVPGRVPEPGPRSDLLDLMTVFPGALRLGGPVGAAGMGLRLRLPNRAFGPSQTPYTRAVDSGRLDEIQGFLRQRPRRLINGLALDRPRSCHLHRSISA